VTAADGSVRPSGSDVRRGVGLGQLTGSSVWDGAAGRDTGDEFITKTAAEIVAKHPAPKRLDKDPKTWIDEGLLFSVREVYTFGVDNGTKEKPNTLPAGYLENAQRVAHERIALAGYRLAAILNKKLN
jgi:hypothetical protein